MQFPFLQLPAELRNHIYEIAIQMDIERDFIQLSIPRKADFDDDEETLNEGKVMHWGFTGLTQTCRQIRSEFHHLYIRNVKIQINPFNLNNFAKVFLSGLRPKAVHVLLVDTDGDPFQVGENIQIFLVSICKRRSNFITFFDVITEEGNYTVKHAGIASVFNNIFEFRKQWARGLRRDVVSMSLTMTARGATGVTRQIFVWHLEDSRERYWWSVQEFDESFLKRVGVPESAWYNFKRKR